MLAASSNPGPSAVDPPPEARKWCVAVTTLIDAVANPGTMERFAIRVLPVGRIAVKLSLLPMEEIPELLTVVLGCVRGRDGMHQALFVGAHVDLHAEVPRVALLGLAHLRGREFRSGSWSNSERR